MLEEAVVERTAKPDSLVLARSAPVFNPRLSEVVPGFLRHGQFDLSWVSETVRKYGECLNWVIRDLGDLPVTDLRVAHVTEIKQKVMMRGAGAARVGSMVFPIKSLLRYCRDVLELDVIDQTKIRPPKHHHREVVFLTNEEIQQFVDSIKINNTWEQHTKKNCIRRDGLRFRTLVEVLLGTGMRISEALSLNRDSIDFEKKEAKIIGKGNKERTVFFNDRSLEWIKRWMEVREDDSPALFPTQGGTRWNKDDVEKLFRDYAKKSWHNKKTYTPYFKAHDGNKFIV